MHDGHNPNMTRFRQVNDCVRELRTKVPARWRIKLMKAFGVCAYLVDQPCHLPVKTRPKLRLDFAVITNCFGQLLLGGWMEQTFH